MNNYEFMIPYPLVVAEGETADALGYSVGSTWTRIYALPGRTGFTAHFIKLAALVKDLPISSACFRLVFQSGDSSQVSVKIIALSYVDGVAVWADDWGTFQRRAAYNPDNQGVDVTAKLVALLVGGADNPQITLEVLGSGVIHEATLEVVYAIPDLAPLVAALDARIAALEAVEVPDHAEALAALAARVAALEAAPAPSPAPVPITIQLPPGGFTFNLAG